MLDKIILKLMICSMANPLMHLDKFLEGRLILLWKFDTHFLKFQTVMNSVTLILYNHVVHDNRSCHHLLQLPWILYFVGP